MNSRKENAMSEPVTLTTLIGLAIGGLLGFGIIAGIREVRWYLRRRK